MLAQPSGILRASLPVDFATIFLAPLIAEFANRYPGISFEFDLTPRKVDLVSEPYDVAIRMGEPEDSSLIARRLAALPGRLYASPRYLERAGTPSTPAELTQHECIGFPRIGAWTLHNRDGAQQVQVGGRFVLNSVGMIRQLALLDMGIILMPYQVVLEDLAADRLRPILPDWQGSAIPVYALTETRLLPAKTQRFIEFLRERLAGEK